jgi:hypothetical protein
MEYLRILVILSLCINVTICVVLIKDKLLIKTKKENKKRHKYAIYLLGDDGEEYVSIYKDKKEFKEMIRKGEFIEYGTYGHTINTKLITKFAYIGED